jgi:DNA-binding winged helix-turn-helix (wHTH) protein/dipeptidyl aminopeptidase/acylaminoacyl peptidase
MAVQYWVGGFFIDLSRNQITQNRQSQTIAPKAMKVLTYLAENRGKVVSRDALLTKVWPDTVVSPNTLERSIAQLRKALGDDGKAQSYIKTHAKQGYSLECDVRWDDRTDSTRPEEFQENPVDEAHTSEANSNIGIASKAERSISGLGLRLIAIVAGLVILATIGYQYLAPKQTSQLTFDKLSSLTATDDKEFDASYSPDGKYIVFNRYLDKQCINKLWAKNISTQKEIQLTKDWGAYGRHSFSKDGKKLVFLATEACSQPVAQRNCYDLVNVDFAKALESPQDPSLILQCQNSDVKHPIWLNNNDIALLQRSSDRWKLISYSIDKNLSTDVYDPKGGNLISYAYSVREDLLAVISIHDDGQHYIEMLKPDGDILSSHLIERPQEISKFRPIFPSFDPLNRQLIFSTGRQLFTLSYEGEITKISFPFADNMAQPTFHPDGKRLLMIKGPYDSDIVLMPLNQIVETSPLTQEKQTQSKQTQTYSSFERSIQGEDYALFQPGGELIAFWSKRSGDQQLWISDGNGPRQLTHFPLDTSIRGIEWAVDGKSLLVNANGVLTQVFLDSSQKTFLFDHPVLRFFQWDSENNSALLIARIKGLLKFVEYDLNNSEIREVNDKKILWALKSEDDRLIYKDYMGQFWQPGPVEAQRIEALDKQGGKSKSFVIKDNIIFAINNENQLWSYDLNNATYKILGEVGEDVDHLTDINQTQLLMTIQVSAKKEVVELTLSK